jgi:hypothetical protein
MKAVFRTAIFTVAVCRLVSPALAGDEATPLSPPPGVEARAARELRRMGVFLASLPRFAFEAEETFDEVVPGEPRRQLTNVRRVAVERPGRLAADVTGDTLNRAAWYDGRTLSTLDKEHDTYAVLDAPATIDATLDLVEESYGVVLPLADFVYHDPYAVLIAGVTYGRYLGLHLAGGVPCHHLAFAQDTIEWQVWIDAGEQPLPRKFVITYVLEPGEPQYSATFRAWNVAPAFPADLFAFVAPDGAQKVEPARLAAPLAKSPPPPAAPKGGQP